MTFVIVCGGTAGHINPGLSIAEELRSRLPDSEILFIGAGRALERRLIPEAGFALVNIKMTGIKRSLKPGAIAHNIKTVLNVIIAGRKAAGILRKKMPNAVIGTGGYICYPVLNTAARLKIPTYILESNAIPGMTVKMLSRVADRIMVTYSGYERYYKHPERVTVTGTPVRKGFTSELDNSGTDNTSKPDVLKRSVINHTKKPLVISFWGSLGAERMNEIMAGVIKHNLTEKRFYHIHAAGNSRNLLNKELAKTGILEIKPPYADVRDYIDNMPQVMRAADLVLCRAGANTLAELTALGKPCILVPSPYVPDKVQFVNAEQLQKRGAAILIDESRCNADMLYKAVAALVEDNTRLSAMSEASKGLSALNATEKIADIILSDIK